MGDTLVVPPNAFHGFVNANRTAHAARLLRMVNQSYTNPILMKLPAHLWHQTRHPLM
jgi:hypothetical protein